MKVHQTSLSGVLLLEPQLFEDDRGFFYESYSARVFREDTGLDPVFVQDNHSRSKRGVVRGLHYQLEQAQCKLVRVTSGRIFDVAVDLRRSSPTFGRWAGFELSEANRRMAWIPAGFGHGFLALSESADVQYKVDNFYHRESDRALVWNDPDIGIAWPLADLGGTAPLVSAKDAAARRFRDGEMFE